jgi:RNA polymerase sigma factor (sigma-70 family)
MAKGQLDTVLQRIHRMSGARLHAELSDGQLLRRFVADRDEAAFAALVQRHGGLVVSVCRRVLSHEQDAEDAFQATFLILSRKAAAIRNLESVASWLHGVAQRTALNARKSAMRRRKYEKPSEERSAESPVSAAALKELQALLDEEVQRLPERYRAAFVLCCLEGKSRPEAARELGWKEGTVSSRLARARELLQQRLSRRGVTLTAALCAVALTQRTTEAAVSAALADGTIKAVLGFTTGNATGAISAQAVALTEGVLKAMFLSKVKRGVVLLVVLALLAVGVGVAATQPQPAVEAPTPPTPGEEKPKRADQPAEPLPEEAIQRMGTLRLRLHTSPIDAVAALSPDLQKLAWIGVDDRLHLWETASAKELWQIPYPETPVYGSNYSCAGVAFSPDGKTVAVGGKTLSLWESATGKELWHSEEYKSGCGCITFAPDGKWLALVDHAAGTVHLWNVADRKEVRTFGNERLIIRSLAISSDGKTLAVGAVNKAIQLWDVATGEVISEIGGNKIQVHTVAFTADGKIVVSGCYDRTIRFWDVATRKKVRILTGATGLTFSSDGDAMTWTKWDEPNVVHLGETATGKEIGHFKARGLVYLTRFSPDGKTLAEVGRGELHLWEIATRKEIVAHHFPGHPFEVAHLVFAPDGKTLVSASQPRGSDQVCHWDAVTGKLLHQFSPGGPALIYASGFAADGQPVALGCEQGTIRLWDVTSGKERFGLGPMAEGEYVHAAISPNGKWLVVQRVDPHSPSRGAHRMIRVWDTATGKELWKFGDERTAEYQTLAFTPDGKTLAGFSVFGLDIQRWDVTTGRELAGLSAAPEFFGGCAEDNFRGLRGLAFSTDGNLAASYNEADGTMRVWETATRKKLFTLPLDGQAVTALSISPDRRVLAIAQGRAIRLLELATGTERHRFTGHQRAIESLAFSLDGKTLASGSEDTTILVWDLTGKAASSPRGLANLTAKELDGLWEDLGGEAPRAYRAMRRLTAATPAETATFLKDRLQGLESPTTGINRLIKDLDDDEFEVREKATTELAKLGKAAEPRLHEVLKEQPTVEVRRRVEGLLDKWTTSDKPMFSPQELTAIRGIEVLEHIGGAEARQVLEKLARGAAEDRRTQEAKAALSRLGRK